MPGPPPQPDQPWVGRGRADFLRLPLSVVSRRAGRAFAEQRRGGGCVLQKAVAEELLGRGQGVPVRRATGVPVCQAPGSLPARLGASPQLFGQRLAPRSGPGRSWPSPEPLAALLSSAGSQGCGAQPARRCHGNQGCKPAA